jgi:AraC-like DNA-binding protein
MSALKGQPDLVQPSVRAYLNITGVRDIAFTAPPPSANVGDRAERSPGIDPLLIEAVIPPSVLAGVIDIGQRESLDVAAWFAGTGVDSSHVMTSAAAKVSFRQAAVVLRRALRAMPGRPIGMQLGGRDVLLTFGMLGVAMRASATADDALTVARQLHQAAGSLVDIETEISDDDLRMRLYERSPEPDLVAFLCEETFCSTVAFVRSFVDANMSPSHLELTYASPRYVSEYHRFFRCPITFGAPVNCMSFPATMLSLPMATHDHPTRAVAVDACLRLLDTGNTRHDLVTAVETLVAANVRHPITMAQVAQQLHLSERTLRRQLGAAGERFGHLRDRVRERRATFLLTESALPIGAVALEVGFSDAREFRRAYIRWTGHPPSNRRRRE